MEIFVGNLSFEANEHDLLRLFKKFGDVLTITIIMDKNGVKSRGFGFVEMPDDDKAKAAIAALDGVEFMGRNLNVSQARPKPQPQQEPRRREQYARRGERPSGQARPDVRRGGQTAGQAKPRLIKEGRRSRSFLRRMGLDKREDGGEVVQVRRNLKPWQRRKPLEKR